MGTESSHRIPVVIAFPVHLPERFSEKFTLHLRPLLSQMSPESDRPTVSVPDNIIPSAMLNAFFL